MFPRILPPHTLLLMVACALPTLAIADDLVIPVGAQGADKASLERPARWMTTAAVEEKFGAPLSKGNPVGTPPITSWEYPEYRVYFEGDRVLHTVLNPMSTEPAAIPEAPAAPKAPAAEVPVPEAPVEASSETPATAPTPEAPAQVE